MVGRKYEGWIWFGEGAEGKYGRKKVWGVDEGTEGGVVGRTCVGEMV